MAHYFENDEKLLSSKFSFNYEFSGEPFQFMSDRGVFSKDYLDYGSYLLLKEVYQLPLGSSLLDLGCGYGPIGIILKRMQPQLDLVQVDVNERAISLAQENAYLNKIESEILICHDICELNRSFTTICLNPPIHAGKKLIFELYEKARLCLEEGGSFYVVIKKKHGASSTLTKLQEIFNQAEVLNKESTYWIIRAQ